LSPSIAIIELFKLSAINVVVIPTKRIASVKPEVLALTYAATAPVVGIVSLVLLELLPLSTILVTMSLLAASPKVSNASATPWPLIATWLEES